MMMPCNCTSFDLLHVCALQALANDERHLVDKFNWWSIDKLHFKVSNHKICPELSCEIFKTQWWSGKRGGKGGE